MTRTLGPEFGGSIGCLLYVAKIFHCGQTVSALAEALIDSFGPGGMQILNYPY